MFVQTENTPNPNSLKFLPGKRVSNNGSFEVTKKEEIDNVITQLKNIGVIFYAKKTSTIYIADEMVRVIRKIREKEIADKFFRRVLRLFKEPQINLIARKHNIDRKKLLRIFYLRNIPRFSKEVGDIILAN